MNLYHATCKLQRRSCNLQCANRTMIAIFDPRVIAKYRPHTLAPAPLALQGPPYKPQYAVGVERVRDGRRRRGCWHFYVV